MLATRSYPQTARRRVEGTGRAPPSGGAVVAEVLRYTRQVLASTSKRGQTVATNNLRAREAEEVRKPVGENGAEVPALIYSALLSGPVIEEASSGGG
jgi:hypothetical protein